MQPVETEPEPETRPPEELRTFRRNLLLIVAIGATWRVGVLVVDKWRQPLLLNDSLYYSAQARQLVDGVWFREIFVDQPGAEHGPLTSVLLATVSWVDDPVPWQRLLTVLCGIATIAVVGLLARRLCGARVALVAAAIAAAYPNLWMNDGLVMSESLSVLLVCLTLWTAHRILTRPTMRGAVLVGAVAGLAALARSELALLAPAIIVLLVFEVRRTRLPDQPWKRAVRTPVLVGLASLVTVLPWVLFNLARFDESVTLTTNDGTTLLGSYCDASFSGQNIGGWSLLCVVADPDYAMDEEPSVRSARQRGLAIDYAKEHVRDIPKVVAARIGRTLDLYGLDSLVAQDVGEERYRWASWAGIAAWWTIALLAIRGSIVLWRATADARWPFLLMLCPVASVLVTTVVFYGGHRIRSSMEATVVVFAALAVVDTADRLRRRVGDRTERLRVDLARTASPEGS